MFHYFQLTFPIIFFLVAFLYIRIWRFFFKKKVPTGFGVILAIFVFIISFFLNFDLNIKLSLLAITFFASIYYIDDLFDLPTITRFIIQFITGGLIGFIVLSNLDMGLKNVFITILLFGCLSVILTNVTNFYDGLDLNLSFFIIAFILPITYFFDLSYYSNQIIIIIALIIIVFSFFNAIPKSLYFGDSGCFVISNLFILIFVIELSQNNHLYLLLPGYYFPIIDVVFVVLLRITLKEKILTKNHYHVYQLYYKYLKGYFYLIILPINAIILMIFYKIMISNELINNEIIFSFLAIMISFIYFVLCKLMLHVFKKKIIK